MSSQHAANFVPEVTVSGDQWGLTGPARKMIPVATEGPLGASYTVYEKNWTCADCGHENYASKARCHRCWRVCYWHCCSTTSQGSSQH